MTTKRYRPNAGQILFRRRANAPSQVFVGKRFGDLEYGWQMPQGGIEEGEDPQAGALRELEEETGVSPHHVTVVGESARWYSYDFPEQVRTKLFKGKYDGQKQKWFAIELDPSASDDVININTQTPEFSEWKWVTMAETIDIIVPFKRYLYRAIFEELGGIVG